MRKLRLITPIVAFIVVLPPFAHFLEMPSKLTLDGPLWLGIQQHLYRGWGPVFGPIIILALLLSLLQIFTDRQNRRSFVIATLCYAAMLACFFIFNDPVNAALNRWTPSTLPSDWTNYRLRWEIGHTLSAIFSAIAFATLLRPYLRRGQ
jgi:hypothetical protein